MYTLLKSLLVTSLLLLSGCGTTVSDAVTALGNDKANACVIVHNAYPPFASDFTYIHQGDPNVAAPTCK